MAHETAEYRVNTGQTSWSFQGGSVKWTMFKSIELEAPLGTSLKSLVRGYLLTHQTEGSSPNTIEYYRGILDRFLWYATTADWVDDARLLNEWHIREFLGYVGTEINRWAKEGSGSQAAYPS